MPGFDPDQPRDEKGQWTATGSSEAIKAAAGDKNIHSEEVPKIVVTNEVEGEKAMKDYFKTVSEDEKIAVVNYTASDYADMNNALRKEREDLINDKKRDIKALDDFLNDAPKFDGISYRGLRFMNNNGYESFKFNVDVGNVIQDKAYGSTSLLKDLPAFTDINIAPYLVRIEIKGKSGVYLGTNAAYGDIEKEVLYPRGTKFKVIDLKEEKKSTISDPEGRLLKLKLEEL